MKIILITGKAEAGKTTVANLLKAQLQGKTAVVGFASILKQTAKTFFGWDGEKDEQGRSLLQHVGDVGRAYSLSLWADMLLRLAKVFNAELDYLLVDDWRFPVEIQAAMQMFPIDTLSLRVTRPNHENALTPEQRQRRSEIALDEFICDYEIINDSDLSTLAERVNALAAEHLA